MKNGFCGLYRLDDGIDSLKLDNNEKKTIQYYEPHCSILCDRLFLKNFDIPIQSIKTLIWNRKKKGNCFQTKFLMNETAKNNNQIKLNV